MKIEIRHRITQEVIKTIEAKNLRSADLCGADLRSANLREADLWGAKIKVTQKEELLKSLSIEIKE